MLAIILGAAFLIWQYFTYGHNQAPADYKAKAQLERIAEACHSYAKEHGGRFPPDLATLVVIGKIPLSALVDPRASAWREPNDSPKEDFIYLGRDLPAGFEGSAAARELVLVYTRATNIHHAHLMAMANGDFQYADDATMPYVKQVSNSIRHGLGLPPLSP